MRFVVALVAAVLVLVLVGCSSSDGREASLRETVADYVRAWQDRDPQAYDLNHESYREACSPLSAEQLFDTVDTWYGPDWDTAELRILWIEIDEDRATVDYDLYVDGRSIGFGEPRVFWLYEDGHWWRASENPKPCSPQTAFGSVVWKLPSLEEAVERTGYDIATPGFVPGGYEPVDDIAVVNHFRVGRSVEQAWAPADGSSRFSLRQDQTQTQLGGGEPFSIPGLSGERKLLPVDSTRPNPLLTLLWHDGEFTFILSALLVGSLTEDVLLDVAASVAID
ncbi:MAG: hypothetical protein IH957_02375 [Chloroflexi bacterium]|nr:hypothetical protein [Chloroflexota bacterium]